MHMSNREILRKTDLALADLSSGGGILQPAQAQNFIRLLIDESVLMKYTQVKPMKAQKEEVDKIRFTNRILRSGQEATALSEADRAKPDTSKVELDVKLFKAEVNLNNEVLEDSIEKGKLRDTIMEQMGEAIARDMDEVLVRGDTTSADPFLAKFNGLLKAVNSNQVDAAGQPLTKAVMREMLKTMPSPYIRNRKLLRYFTSIDAKIDYDDTQADRQTPWGDKRFQEDTSGDSVYSGIPVIDVPLFPEDLGVGSDETNVVLSDPKNLLVGIWRQIRMETDKLVREGVLVIVATLRFDFKLVEETASVKAIHVKKQTL